MPGFWRRRTLRRHALPDADWAAVCARLPLVAGMSPQERELLREQATLFLAHKIVAPSAGFELQPAQAIEIAIWASLPVLHRGTEAYAGFRGVIVYPDEFLAPREETDEAGVVHVGHERVAGEAWDAGPILLSWADVEASRRRGSGSVVIHECAHKLDLGDGAMNGVPDLSGSGITGAEWARVMQDAWERLGREEQAGGCTSIDDYALESPAEFFAVLSEEFFTAPAALRRALPEAHALLRRYYTVDSEAWWLNARREPRRTPARRHAAHAARTPQD
jgi:Mlc titration factor MtfA (ptsG expression regulator)